MVFFITNKVKNENKQKGIDKGTERITSKY